MQSYLTERGFTLLQAVTAPARASLKGETMSEWQRVGDTLPPDGEIVDTKIDDAKGCRNTSHLKRQRNLWYFPDGSMYVYYTPTHWKPFSYLGETR
jgi:hypothetical protein